jgi:hypothetical protein
MGWMGPGHPYWDQLYPDQRHALIQEQQRLSRASIHEKLRDDLLWNDPEDDIELAKKEPVLRIEGVNPHELVFNAARGGGYRWMPVRTRVMFF